MFEYSDYVPVKERIRIAKRKMKGLGKKGKIIEPIKVDGRIIAKKFWGNLWCKHLETFSDYSNRLPRGRTYVRNGSVCHLGIQNGTVESFVAGTETYEVTVEIKPLAKKKWKSIKEKCSGQIGSMLELLKGKLSDQVMKLVADHREGLFPKEGEISFSCSCYDWAGMCKHIAAVLYGIGSRLDKQPELLFSLRGVDANELITSKLSTVTEETEDLMGDEGLAEIFGIELEDSPDQPSKARAIKGIDLRKIRLELKLSVKEFARTLDVSAGSIYRWEKESGVLNLQTRTAKAIAALVDK